MGDFNLNILNVDTHKPTSEYVDLMFSHAMLPMINKPTRSTTDSHTCIDNIFSNHMGPDSKSLQGILFTDITDHFPVFFIDLSTKNKNEKRIVARRSFTTKAKENFKSKIDEFDWTRTRESTDAQEAMSLFHSNYKRIFDECFPVRKIELGYKHRKEWLSDDIKKQFSRKINCSLCIEKNQPSTLITHIRTTKIDSMQLSGDATLIITKIFLN